ncbi:MAG: hypothetical protein AVDCRST_MAG22-318, partial [uncultured Rubrobacteraceae bacterium]
EGVRLRGGAGERVAVAAAGGRGDRVRQLV